MESYNSFHVAQQQINEAAKLLNLDEATTELLSTPQLETSFTLPVKMDDGEVKIFQHTVFNTTLPVVLQKVEYVFIRMKQLIQYVHLRAG